ncbi:MAG TPA: DUF2786 domain-containing protein [Blastococcus sp.]|jgi:hypothetical protein|nr:DUF2786 domain-containing protein [Blastococcus sp.]
MFDDAWVSDLLQHRSGTLADALVTQELADMLGEHRPEVDSGGIATRELLRALEDTWERGWQPADVVHAARRQATAASVPLAVALIGEHARRSDALSRAPDAWLAQLRELGALPGRDPAVVMRWHRAERRTPADAWRIVLSLMGFLRTAVRIDVLVPPPSRWGPPRARSAAEPAGDDRALRRIRGLLTKAESTEFPDEAEALTAKAQELMTRHAVDAALLDLGPSASGSAAVGTRRVHVQDPYVRAKMQLLGAVAGANDVRLVWYQSLGIANLVGATSDADAVELLFTSLLLQVAQALAAAERSSGPGPASRSFRRSFLLGYAHRIGERLTTARERATAEASAEARTTHGVDLLPVLRSRQAAVEKRMAELFPHVRSGRSRASVDAGGWYAGRAAAEGADVGKRRSSLR